jgi:hypothetical protein
MKDMQISYDAFYSTMEAPGCIVFRKPLENWKKLNKH